MGVLRPVSGALQAVEGPGIISAYGGGSGAGARASLYDGSNDSVKFLMPELVDSTKYLISFWFKPNNDGADQKVYQSPGGKILVLKNASNTWSFFFKESGGTALVIVSTLGKPLAGSGWHHIICSGTTGAGARLYLDGAEDDSVATNDAGTIDWQSGTTNIIGANGGQNAQFFNGCLSELYINDAVELDLSSVGNRQLFRSASGYPVSLGPRGETPTGSPPKFYSPNADEFNLATGEEGVVTGLLEVCGSTPG